MLDDPNSNAYRFLRGEVLLRSGNWLAKLGRAGEARAAANEGLALLAGLASAPSPSLSHLFGACRWFAETEVKPLRDPGRAPQFCRQAIERTTGSDPRCLHRTGGSAAQMGDRAAAVEAASKALSLLPPSAPNQPKTQQRADMEAAVHRFRRAAHP